VLGEIFLTTVADAFFHAFTGKVTNTIYERLTSVSTKRAFKRALGLAIKSYAIGERLPLAPTLLAKDSFLSQSEVAVELAQVLSMIREPDTTIIGKQWQSAAPPELRGHYDFVAESNLFIRHLRQELLNSSVFRPVLESHSLDVIAQTNNEAVTSIAEIEQELDQLNSLLREGFGQLLGYFAATSSSIRRNIQPSASLIEEKTRFFVGRQWAFDAVQRFKESHRRGYFFIYGEPGIGKSSLAAQLVKSLGAIHHFNIRAEGVSNASSFLRNVCAQLIAAYSLPYSTLPSEFDNVSFFKAILQEVSATLGQDSKCLIVIDALDEVTDAAVSGENPLCLPVVVPNGIYIIVTSRADERKAPRIECEADELLIRSDSPDNLEDVADFVRGAATGAEFDSFISSQRLTKEKFVNLMVERSEGNFMYLRYVLPEVANGMYKDAETKSIPTGLSNYYLDHWRRMRGLDEEAWFQYKLPVIVALTLMREPVTLAQLAAYSGIQERALIQSVLREWAPFLHTEQEEARQHRSDPSALAYRVYHSSFFDFLSKRQEVVAERIDLQAAHRMIADAMERSLYESQ
jgi:hypothetical protein